jgi:lipopolysaccharide export system ATP-binding protein
LEKLVEEFQLTKFLKTKSIKLSGGERRRVEIARSLSSNPSFILLDEPFAGIDPKAVSELKETLKKLKNLKLGILISDHNVRETMQICDNVLIMNEGKVIAEGTPEKVSANDLVKEIYLGQDF